MSTIWITGSQGQLGTELRIQNEKFPEHNFLFTDIKELDLTHEILVRNFAEENHPDIIINCAAYTAVDKAESDTKAACLLNRDVPALLTEVSASINAVLIHISTDYVFDGTACKPYLENDLTNPQSEYGRSKLAGEKAVLSNPDNLILRTSWLYSAHGNNFVKTMLKLGRERDEIGVVSDQAGSPTSASDLANALLIISNQILSGKRNTGGIYHYSNEGICSWYDFAMEIMEEAGINCYVKPLSSREFPTPARRPFYSVLNKSKIKETFEIEISHWRESLKSVLRILTTEK